jgi:hypothetical protein
MGMHVRWRSRATLIAAVTATGLAAAGTGIALAAGGGQAGVSVQPDGAWTGCGDVARVTAVRVQREVSIRGNGWKPLAVTQRHPPAARRLFYDFCVIAGHHARAPSVMSCPADVGLSYDGAFYAGRRRVATFDYYASGCQDITVRAGRQSTGTLLIGPALAAEPRGFGADLSAVLGIPQRAIWTPPG